MKLRYSTTSPFVRKVNVTALETGLDDRVERAPTDPWDPGDDLSQHNPLGKVPALITDEDEALYDSIVIAEYLDSLHDGPKVFPPAGPERWQALRLHALGDGILEAAVLRLVESRRRPQELRWTAWVERQSEKINRALDVLEGEADKLEGPVTIGTITVGIALGYLDFRFPDVGWRDGRPDLTAWYEVFAQRPSMQATIPKLPA